MRSGKGNINNNNHEEDEYEDDDYASKKDGPSSNTTTSANNNSNTNRDGKNSDKASAMRSKHSVTEQRRRSKINERFQILRDLIPHSDQKRDTASFLLEVIEYVQYLQEKMQKYEGSYQGWSSEPTKLMPWRNSHWRVQNFVGHPQPQAIKNGSGSGLVSTFVGKLDENNVTLSSSMLVSTQNPAESDHSMDVVGKAVDPLPEVVKGVLPVPMPLRACIPATARSDGMLSQPLQIPASDAQCPITRDTLNQQEDLAIEGGTISFSSVYSQGLLNTLTQALHSAGIDLSQASVSVQIDLGKRANRGLNPGTSTTKEQSNHTRDASSGEESDQAQKRLKTSNL